MDSDCSLIESGDETTTEDLAGLMQKMRTEFATLAGTLTQQAKEQIATFQALLDAQAATIQVQLD